MTPEQAEAILYNLQKDLRLTETERNTVLTAIKTLVAAANAKTKEA